MPDPIAAHIPACPLPPASDQSTGPMPFVAIEAENHAEANANANADTNIDIEPDTGWHRLPAELIVHIGSFLPWQALDALGRTHRRSRQALAACTVHSRVGWRIVCVSSLSMFTRTAGELRSALLSDMQRAQALGALAGRLPSLDGRIVSAARDVLLDQIAQLAVPQRAQPLDGVMQGLARCHQSVVHQGGAWPLLTAAHTVAPARRGAALIACLRIPSLTRSAMPSVTQWIDEALALPTTERV